MPEQNLLTCPFCKESDFDDVGLKIHLNECETFKQLSVALLATGFAPEQNQNVSEAARACAHDLFSSGLLQTGKITRVAERIQCAIDSKTSQLRAKLAEVEINYDLLRTQYLKPHDDSIVGSCDCNTKTPEIGYHVTGCRYRLISERDSLKQQVEEMRVVFRSLIDARKNMGNPSLTPLDKTRFEQMEAFLQHNQKTENE